MKNTALLFAGQGAQFVGMGHDFYQQSATAKVWFERANKTVGYDLAGLCFGGPEATLTETQNAQPGIFLVSWVAFQLLKEACPALHYAAAAGLSLGEFTALSAAGVLSFEDGLRIVRQRGEFMNEACLSTRGGMAAIIGLDVEATQKVCDESGVQLANLNCPGQIVISGEADKMDQACELAKTRGAKRALPLQVAGAYHSKLMESAQPKLKAALAGVPLNIPSIPVISNVTAKPHVAPVDIHQRLVDQVTSPVRWEDSMHYLLGEGFNRFIELGPGTALSGFVKRIDKSVEILNVADCSSLEVTAKVLTAS